MNIPLISGQIALLHVKLETEDDFELYGGTTKAGFSITPERPESKNEWLVTIDEQEVAGKPLTRFDVYVRQISSWREWVVLSGKILVTPRSAGVDADKLAPIAYNVTIPVVENAVDLTGAAIVTGIPGPRGWSAYEIAVQNGFEGTEAEWLEYMRQQTATLAVEQVTPLMERAETAAGNAKQFAADASNSLVGAKSFARGAEDEADRADAAADKAAQHEETVRGLITNAAAHEQAAAKSAQAALAAQQSAKQAAQDAQTAKNGAEQAAANADASKSAAQTAEGNAKASANAAAADKTATEKAKQDAQAAQSKAEQEAAKAEGYAGQLGDAALQGRNNTFDAGTTQTVNGIGVFNGEVVLNGDLSGAAVIKERAMEALREFQGYSKGVSYVVQDSSVRGCVMERLFSTTAADGTTAGYYYLPKVNDNDTNACMLLRYDRNCGVELGATNFDRRLKVYPSQENSLYSNVWGDAGNSIGCFSSAFIYGSHLYIKQSHSETKGHYSFSVYDLGENDVLTKTNKLVLYLGNGFSNYIKVAIWGLVGDELQLVTSFRSGVAYWGVTNLGFVLKGSASDIYAARDNTPQLNSYVISKNAEAPNKSYLLANNDVSAVSIATLEAAGGEFVINFSPDAGCNWIFEHLPEWLTAEVSEVENGGQLVLTVLPNDGAARTGYMRFKSVGNHAFGYPCTIHNDVQQKGV